MTDSEAPTHLDAKAIDREKIVQYLKGRREATVNDIIDKSGANVIRVYSILFELQLENKLMVVEEEKFGSPRRVALVERVRPMEEFSDEFFDWMIEQAEQNPRLRWNYNLHATLQAPAQRLLYALMPGTRFPIHRHRDTTETYVLLRGKFDIVEYDEAGRETRRRQLSGQGLSGGQIAEGRYHTLEVAEPTIILLVKDGPYEPFAEQDILHHEG